MAPARKEDTATPADASTNPGAALLFSAGTGGLSARDRIAIFDALGLVFTLDGAGFVDGLCAHPAARCRWSRRVMGTRIF